MLVFADTHIHLYGCYSLDVALHGAWERFCSYAKGREALFILYLTERAAESLFQNLLKSPSSLLGSEFSVHRRSETVLEISIAQKGSLYLVAGRQLATKGRLEILALDCAAELPDDLELPEAVDRVLAAGGVPVLNWSLGKWLGTRAKIIETEILRADPSRVLIGDVAARPKLWPEPKLFELARVRGFRLIFGSDPLPFPGEEEVLGRYVTELLSSGVNAADICREWLRSPPEMVTPRGNRDGIFQCLYRYIRNQQVRGKVHRSSC